MNECATLKEIMIQHVTKDENDTRNNNINRKKQTTLEKMMKPKVTFTNDIQSTPEPRKTHTQATLPIRTPTDEQNKDNTQIDVSLRPPTQMDEHNTNNRQLNKQLKPALQSQSRDKSMKYTCQNSNMEQNVNK